MSNNLYKFFPLALPNGTEKQKYWDHLEDALSGKLYFSTMTGLNDPHEALRITDRGYYSYVNHPGSKPTLDDYTIMKANKKSVRKFGLVCFSKGEAYKDQRMWAHYTEKGIGVCIEYKINESFLYTNETPGDPNNSDNHSIRMITSEEKHYKIAYACGNVQYQEQPLKFDSDTMNPYYRQALINAEKSATLAPWVSKGTHHFQVRTHFVKYTQWDYEKEYRIVARIEDSAPEDTDWRKINICEIKDSKCKTETIIHPTKVIISLKASFDKQLIREIQLLADKYSLSVKFIHTNTKDYDYSLEDASMIELYPYLADAIEQSPDQPVQDSTQLLPHQALKNPTASCPSTDSA